MEPIPPAQSGGIFVYSVDSKGYDPGMGEHQPTHAMQRGWTALWNRIPKWQRVALAIVATSFVAYLVELAPQSVLDALVWTVIGFSLLSEIFDRYFASPHRQMLKRAEEFTNDEDREPMTLYEGVVLVVICVIGAALVTAFVLLSFWLASYLRNLLQ